MRVTVISGMVPPAAAPEGVHAVMLSGHLAKAGCDVTLVTSRAAAGGLPVAWRDPAVDFRPGVRSWGWRGLPSLRRELKRSRPDAVLLFYVSYMYGRQPMITYLPTLCRTLRPRPRMAVKFTNTPGADPRSFGARLGRKLAERVAGGSGLEWRYGTLLRDSDALVAFCEPHLRHLLNVYPRAAEHAHIIPAPACMRIVDDPDGSVRRNARQQLGFADGDFVAAYFGYVYPEKGLETLVEAAALAKDRLPNLRVLIIGDSPEIISLQRYGADPSYPQRIREYPAKLGMADRFTWTGYCEDEAASAYLRAADACVLPFVNGVRLNNTTYAVAANHGLPVITTRGESLEAAFVDRRNALLCWASDAKDMADALVEVATDAGLRRTLADGSAEFARGRSSWPAIVQQTLQLFAPAAQPTCATATAAAGPIASPAQDSVGA